MMKHSKQAGVAQDQERKEVKQNFEKATNRNDQPSEEASRMADVVRRAWTPSRV